MGCLFTFLKFVYSSLTLAIVLLNISYIYNYFSKFTLDDFFSNNHFAHSMGMLLGILFRISGFLSALKEKIALTTAYALFVTLVLLLHQRFDDLFYLYLATVICAFLYIIALKYRKSLAAKRRDQETRSTQQQHRGRRARNGLHQRESTLPVSSACTGSTNPSAPPIEFISPGSAPQPGANPNYVVNMNSSLYDLSSVEHHTPPPSYAELYDNK